MVLALLRQEVADAAQEEFIFGYVQGAARGLPHFAGHRRRNLHAFVDQRNALARDSRLHHAFGHEPGNGKDPVGSLIAVLRHPAAPQRIGHAPRDGQGCTAVRPRQPRRGQRVRLVGVNDLHIIFLEEFSQGLRRVPAPSVAAHGVDRNAARLRAACQRARFRR